MLGKPHFLKIDTATYSRNFRVVWNNFVTVKGKICSRR